MIRAARVTGQRQCVGPGGAKSGGAPARGSTDLSGAGDSDASLAKGVGCAQGDPAMTTYIVDCETCLHRGTYPTREAAIAEAEAHAKARPDHTVNVTEEQDDEDVRA